VVAARPRGIPARVTAGHLMRSLRREAGLSLEQLGGLAGRDPSFLGRLEHGTRRARLTTWQRIASAISRAAPRTGSPEEVTSRLVAAAGSLPRPSPGWEERQEWRRKRRQIERARAKCAIDEHRRPEQRGATNEDPPPAC
jgi:transcriptional regulator with XRE-family HTH domain